MLILNSSCGFFDRFKTPEATSNNENASENSVEELAENTEDSNNSSGSTSGVAANSQSEKNSPQQNSEDAFFSEVFNEGDQNNGNANANEIKNTVAETQNNAAVNNSLQPSAEEELHNDVGPEINRLEEQVLEGKTSESTPPNQKIQIKDEEIKVGSLLNNEDVGELSTDIGQYTVKSGDTLMQIAFQLYGDIGKWKVLKELNQNILSKKPLVKGAKIRYYIPEKAFSWTPKGNPYLIKDGDTLGIISNNVYQTPKKWKALWENNKPLIKNPNRIYAGFTLYYVTEGMAEVDQLIENASDEIRTIQASKVSPQMLETKQMMNQGVTNDGVKSDKDKSDKDKSDDELMNEIENFNDRELQKIQEE